MDLSRKSARPEAAAAFKGMRRRTRAGGAANPNR